MAEMYLEEQSNKNRTDNWVIFVWQTK